MTNSGISKNKNQVNAFSYTIIYEISLYGIKQIDTHLSKKYLFVYVDGNNFCKSKNMEGNSIKKLWYIYTMEYYSLQVWLKKRNLEIHN